MATPNPSRNATPPDDLYLPGREGRVLQRSRRGAMVQYVYTPERCARCGDRPPRKGFKFFVRGVAYCNACFAMRETSKTWPVGIGFDNRTMVIDGY